MFWEDLRGESDIIKGLQISPRRPLQSATHSLPSLRLEHLVS